MNQRCPDQVDFIRFSWLLSASFFRVESKLFLLIGDQQVNWCLNMILWVHRAKTVNRTWDQHIPLEPPLFRVFEMHSGSMGNSRDHCFTRVDQPPHFHYSSLYLPFTLVLIIDCDPHGPTPPKHLQVLRHDQCYFGLAVLFLPFISIV